MKQIKTTICPKCRRSFCYDDPWEVACPYCDTQYATKDILEQVTELFLIISAFLLGIALLTSCF